MQPMRSSSRSTACVPAAAPVTGTYSDASSTDPCWRLRSPTEASSRAGESPAAASFLLLFFLRVLLEHFFVLDDRVRDRRPPRVVTHLDDQFHDLLLREPDVLGAAVM